MWPFPQSRLDVITTLLGFQPFFSVPSPSPSESSHCTPFDATRHVHCTISNRTYLLHRPASYDGTTPHTHALVLSFHGQKGNSARQETLSQFSDSELFIDGKGIFAAYPQGVEGEGGQPAWEGAPYAADGVDDVSLVWALLPLPLGD